MGRHTLTFYTGSQPSNSVNVDVVAYGGPYINGNVPQAGSPSNGQILIDSRDAVSILMQFQKAMGDTFAGPGVILVDSTAAGFDPTAPVTGEAI
jgi:hypothetical protein